MPLDPNQQYAEILGRPDQQPSMTSYNPTVSQTLRNLVAGPQSSPTWTSIVDHLLGTGAQMQQQPGARDINVLNALGVPDVPMGQTPSREDIQNQAMVQALKLKRYSSTGVYDRTYHMMDESGQKVGSLSTQWKPWKNELYVSGMQSDLPTSVPGTEAAHANAAAHSLGAANIRSIVDELKREYPKAETITAVRSSGARHSAAASGERGQFDEMPLASIDVSQPRNVAPETIASAATRIGGKTYSGPTHGHAFSQAEDELKLSGKMGREAWQQMINNIKPEDEGFLTSKGRFVSREEANRIASRGSQINKNSPYYGPTSLASESLRK